MALSLLLIRPEMSWELTINELATSNVVSLIFADDISALPVRKIRDNLIDSFFTEIHRGFPIVDEERIRSQYNDPTNLPPFCFFRRLFLSVSRF